MMICWKGSARDPPHPQWDQNLILRQAVQECWKRERGCTGRAATMTHSPVSESGATFTQVMDPLIFDKRNGRRHTMGS